MKKNKSDFHHLRVSKMIKQTPQTCSPTLQFARPLLKHRMRQSSPAITLVSEVFRKAIRKANKVRKLRKVKPFLHASANCLSKYCDYHIIT